MLTLLLMSCGQMVIEIQDEGDDLKGDPASTTQDTAPDPSDDTVEDSGAPTDTTTDPVVTPETLCASADYCVTIVGKATWYPNFNQTSFEMTMAITGEPVEYVPWVDFDPMSTGNASVQVLFSGPDAAVMQADFAGINDRLHHFQYDNGGGMSFVYLDLRTTPWDTLGRSLSVTVEWPEAPASGLLGQVFFNRDVEINNPNLVQEIGRASCRERV